MPKSEKTCVVCGVGFTGNAHAETCTPKCRKALSRLLKKGLKPSFALIAAAKKKPVVKPQGKVPPKKEVKIEDLNEPTNEIQNIAKEPPKTNYHINTQKPFMNDAIKKKLGLI